VKGFFKVDLPFFLSPTEAEEEEEEEKADGERDNRELDVRENRRVKGSDGKEFPSVKESTPRLANEWMELLLLITELLLINP